MIDPCEVTVTETRCNTPNTKVFQSVKTMVISTIIDQHCVVDTGYSEQPTRQRDDVPVRVFVAECGTVCIVHLW